MINILDAPIVSSPPEIYEFAAQVNNRDTLIMEPGQTLVIGSDHIENHVVSSLHSINEFQTVNDEFNNRDTLIMDPENMTVIDQSHENESF